MQPFLTQREYQTLAERYVKNFVSRRRLRMSIIDDPDAINSVVDYMMRADSKFDGRGDHYGFRYSYAKFGFQEYLTKNRKNDKNRKLYGRHLSTFRACNEGGDFDRAQDNTEPSEPVESHEIRRKIMESDLTDRQKATIIGCFYDRRPRAEIAKEWGCSRQLIDLELRQALNRLRFVLREFAP